MKDNIKFFQKQKKLMIILAIIVVVGGLLSQLLFLMTEKLTEKDFSFLSVQWTESCDGTNYTEQDRIEFCSNCSSGGECLWPLDMLIEIERIDSIRRTGAEVHCYLAADGVNYYTEQGRYYGIENRTFFTWQQLDASRPHEVEFCCGIQRETFLSKLIGIEQKWPQACISSEVEARCKNE